MQACSQGVNAPLAVSRLRAAHPGWREWLWKQWLERADKLWRTAPKWARGLSHVPDALLPGQSGLLLKSLRGLDRAPLDAYVEITAFPEAFRGGEALLFSGCAGRFAAPFWEEQARSLLAGLGLRRLDADFSCCGATLGSAGLLREQAVAQKRNVEIWRAAGRPLLVAYCASCLHGLHSYDLELFADEAESELWRGRLTPLARLLNSARFVVSENAPAVAAYHRPCHALDPDPDEALLRAMLEERLHVLPDQCCGFGGALKLAAPKLCESVGQRRRQGLASLLSENAPGMDVLTGCTACVFQLAGSAPQGLRPGHWLEVIHERS